ncbi:DUF2207 domain-containing protein [Patescibacteria group bacterium]|nr:DUF2207 domain-containing protein [Patescibacteria group bacterium]
MQYKKVILFLFFFFLSLPVRAEEIRSFAVQVKLNEDATINVQEKIVYDFGSSLRHGIYRVIPFVKINANKKKYSLDFKNFSVTDENGARYKFSELTEGTNLKLKIGDADKTISGVHTYIIDYDVAGAITYFSDHDELYWNITGNHWDVPIDKVSAKIILPESLIQEIIESKCFTGSYGSTEANCETRQDGNEIYSSTNNYLNSNEGLSVVVKLPMNAVAHLEPKEYKTFFETFFGKIVLVIMFVIGVVWYLLLPFYIIYRWFKYGRDPKAVVGETTAWYDPPKTPDGKRFLTPGEVGTLGDETVDLKDISATIVDLARRGYLKIVEKEKKDFYLQRTNKADKMISSNNKGGDREKDELFKYEKTLLDEFFGKLDEIRLKVEKLDSEVEEVKNQLYNQVVADGLFPENPRKVRDLYYLFAFIASVTGNFFLAIVLFIFGRAMPRKTQEGANAYNVAKSLKNFLTSQQRQLEFQADKQMMFERLLPYAVAFGVERVWAKRFKDLGLKQPDWYQGYSTGRFNSIAFASALNSSFNSFRAAATPTSSSSGFSSGFSSGGGFSGGGGGGGGGGSW